MKLQRNYKILWANIIIFSLLFVILTLASGVQEPSITLIKVTKYGFPLQWLKVVSTTIPPLQTNYYASVVELIIDLFIYLLVSLVISFLMFRASRKKTD